MFKFIVIFLLFIISNFGFAEELQSGDVILISFNCYECRVIESETNSTFSHSGVVIRGKDDSLYVLQSLGSVISVPLGQFLKNKRPLSKISVYRPRLFSNFTSIEYLKLTQEMLEVFDRDFLGLKFDSNYLWDNLDENGNELLYCSEFVAKFLDKFLNIPTVPYPLSFNKNYEYWYKYFNGKIPEGVLGNSPNSFTNDPRFEFLLSL
jgi:hypothetical protein